MDGAMKGAIGFLSAEDNDQKFTIELEFIDQVMKPITLPLTPCQGHAFGRTGRLPANILKKQLVIPFRKLSVLIRDLQLKLMLVFRMFFNRYAALRVKYLLDNQKNTILAIDFNIYDLNCLRIDQN